MFDAEVMNSHLASLGAYDIPMVQYREKFRVLQSVRTPWSVNPAA